MTKNNIDYYLGLDISLTSPGFAIIGVENRKPYLVAATHTKTEASKGTGKNKVTFTDGQRLRKVIQTLDDFMEGYEFQKIYKENGFARFATETQKLYKTHGAIEYYLSDYKIEGIAPTSIKKLLTGSGKASKQEVQDAVCKILGVKRSAFDNDDQSDACGVVLSLLIKEGLIDV